MAAADGHYRRAAASLRELSDPFALAVVLLEHAEDLSDMPEAAGWRDEARAIFARLGARPWLARAQGVAGEAARP